MLVKSWLESDQGAMPLLLILPKGTPGSVPPTSYSVLTSQIGHSGKQLERSGWGILYEVFNLPVRPLLCCFQEKKGQPGCGTYHCQGHFPKTQF